jgi:hypothetical protein
MTTPESTTQGYAADFTRTSIERQRAAYAALLQTYNAVCEMEHEGIYEVTVRTQSRAVTVIVPFGTGTDVSMTLWELLGDRLQALENGILKDLRDEQQEAADADSQAFFARQREVQAQCLPQPQAEPEPAPTPAIPFVPRQRPGTRSVHQAAAAVA